MSVRLATSLQFNSDVIGANVSTVKEIVAVVLLFPTISSKVLAPTVSVTVPVVALGGV